MSTSPKRRRDGEDTSGDDVKRRKGLNGKPSSVSFATGACPACSEMVPTPGLKVCPSCATVLPTLVVVHTTSDNSLELGSTGKFWQSAGRGRKQCNHCLIFVPNARRVCMCGSDFSSQKERSVSSTAHEQESSSDDGRMAAAASSTRKGGKAPRPRSAFLAGSEVPMSASPVTRLLPRLRSPTLSRRNVSVATARKAAEAVLSLHGADNSIDSLDLVVAKMSGAIGSDGMASPLGFSQQPRFAAGENGRRTVVPVTLRTGAVRALSRTRSARASGSATPLEIREVNHDAASVADSLTAALAQYTTDSGALFPDLAPETDHTVSDLGVFPTSGAFQAS